MMFRRLQTASAAAVLTAALAGSGAPAGAATDASIIPPGAYSFGTYLTPVYRGAGSYEGVLRITVAKDGTISGVFRNADVGMFHTVVGGVNGKSIWLDLGNDGLDRQVINAAYENGKIVGGIYSGSQPYSFVAAPDPQLGSP